MDDPLVHPSGQPDYVNPQLDKTITTPKQRRELDDTFASFFKEQDEKAATEPSPEPVRESKEEPRPEPVNNETDKESAAPEESTAPTEQKETAKESPVSPAAPASVGAVPGDIDSLELQPSASEEQKGQFAKVKAIAKGFKAKAQAYDKLGPLLRDLGYNYQDTPEDIAATLDDLAPKVKGWKTNALSPEVTKELDTLRGLARAVDYKQSKEYQDTYLKPMQEAYVDVLQEASKYFDAPKEQVDKFLETMTTNYKPQDVDSKWWSDNVIGAMTKADNAVRQKVLSKVADLLRVQEKHDKAVETYGKDPNAYQKWQNERNAQFSNDYAFQIRDEVEKAISSDKAHLKPLLPLETKGVTDPAKIAEINQHNQRFAELERQFSNVIGEFNKGPRTAARYALDFIEMRTRLPELEKTVTEKETHIKTLESEIKKLRDEVATKRKVSDAPLRNGAGIGGKPEPQKKKLSEMSGRRGLDKAFEDLPQG
jgi:hypothetical protein